MQFKIDTSEKYTAIAPLEIHIYDNMAAELAARCSDYLRNEIKNIILNLKEVKIIDDKVATDIAELQQSFYEGSASFVICEMNADIEAVFEKLELLDVLNVTPTLSEAWDIIQMEEIERELLDSDDVEFDVEK